MSTSSKKEGTSRSSSKDSVGSDLIRKVMEKVKKREAKAKLVEAANKAEHVEAIASVSPKGDDDSQDISDEEWISEDEMASAKKNKGKGKGKGKSTRTGRKKKKETFVEDLDSTSETEYTFSKEEQASHVNYTRANPLGKILLQIVDDNLRLQDKVGIKHSSLSGVKLCSSFYLQMEQEKLKVRLAMQESAKETEERIMVRELDSMSINNEDNLPTYFSLKPKLINSHANVEAMKLFPTKSKFSGSSSPDSLTIQEFFANLKTAQESMRLTESEFMKMVLLSTSGKAHDLLLNWSEQGNDLKTIFFNLSLQFDRRMTADEARQKLLTLSVPKNSDVAKHCALILQLATRASHCLPAGSSRQAYMNNEAINCLQRSLPTASRAVCSNMFHQLSSKARRAITFSELTRSLLTLRSTIDADIRANGSGAVNAPSNNRPQGNNSGNSGKPKPGRSGKPRYSSYSVEASYEDEPVQHVTPSKKRYPQNKGNQSNATVFQNNAPAYGNNHQGNGNHAQGTRPQGPNGQSGQKQRPRFGQNNKGKAKQYCSLCGMNNHVAVQGCRNMVDNNGKVIQVQPSQSTCGNCPPAVNPRLNHPPVFCPFRVNGPLYGTK